MRPVSTLKSNQLLGEETDPPSWLIGLGWKQVAGNVQRSATMTLSLFF
ncbi:hypothetical protein [Thermocoleostomius sinensis]|uniref:Uncharacterized protein n=1 Tax=Thermocoleostomius sinensis A174 TaxID=2016057 RepID=A0A9E8ZDL6_9CYAN|nr:hypothetical protein [Thermocoleostomius sinensis]WAL59438.1 hypothetical protein OXH18_20025 [Thermocoleostomius sinensis A174]